MKKLAIGIIAALAVTIGMGASVVSADPPGPAPNQVAGGQVEEGTALAFAYQACQAQNTGSRQVNQAVGPSIGGGLSLLNFRGAYKQQLSNWLCTQGFFASLSEACVPVELVNNRTDEITVLDCTDLQENAAWAATGVAYWRNVVNSNVVGPTSGVICGRFAAGTADLCWASNNLPTGVTQAAIDAAILVILATEGS